MPIRETLNECYDGMSLCLDLLCFPHQVQPLTQHVLQHACRKEQEALEQLESDTYYPDVASQSELGRHLHAILDDVHPVTSHAALRTG